MKKLYALLIILIIVYIGINVGANNLNFTGSDANVVDANSSISLGDGSFPSIENFTDTKVNDTTISLFNPNYNMTINVTLLDNSQNISDIANNLIASGQYTSNQVIDQNGVTTYFLYKEGTDSYGADIYFNKNGQNYLISGYGISYENSDYFINNCKGIIDTLNSTQK